MRTLYVSDLDGTLLRSDAKTSAYTNRVINALTSRGMLFSYATARSRYTSAAVTEGLNARIPIITQNGAIILESGTYAIIAKNTFLPEEKDEILSALLRQGVYPIVYSFQSEREKFSFLPSKCNRATLEFLAGRSGDPRENPVESEEALGRGDVFYFTCIDQPETLAPLYDRFKDRYNCYYQRDIYSGEQWLEIIPRAVSKANAIRQLKAHLGVERVVAFGDGINDREMFELADECYAVENAVEELKAIATGVIGSNDSDGVARWLSERFGLEE